MSSVYLNKRHLVDRSENKLIDANNQAVKEKINQQTQRLNKKIKRLTKSNFCMPMNDQVMKPSNLIYFEDNQPESALSIKNLSNELQPQPRSSIHRSMDEGKDRPLSKSSNHSPGAQRLNPKTNKGIFCSTRVSLKGGEVIVTTDNDYSQELFMKQLSKRSLSRTDKHPISSKKSSRSRSSNNSDSQNIKFNDYRPLEPLQKSSKCITKMANRNSQESKASIRNPVIGNRQNKGSETQIDSLSCNTKITSRSKPVGNYNTGPLYMGKDPPKYQPIVMKRSFHIKQTHDMLELQRKRRELELEMAKNNLETARMQKRVMLRNHDIIPHGRVNFYQIRQQMAIN